MQTAEGQICLLCVYVSGSNDPLKAVHDNGGKSSWAIMAKFYRIGLFRHRTNNRNFLRGRYDAD